MNEKLDKKLAAYEKKRRITNDGELLEALERIIDRETRRPPRKMDTELIAECTKLALTLRGADPAELAKEGAEASRRAAREALEEYRRKNDKETSRTPSPRRLFILIPAIALLVAMMTVVASSSEGHMFTKSEIENMEPGKVYEIDGDDVIIAKDGRNDIKTLEELESIIDDPNVILPFGIEDRYPITYISSGDYVKYKEIYLRFTEQPSDTGIWIKVGETWQNERSTVKVGIFDVHLGQYDDVYCADFQYKDSSYTIRVNSEQQLYYIIERFEEQCNENS